MSEHLPECFYYMDDFGDGERCICDRLRACEQRVREDMALQYLVSDREQQEQEERAFAAGVQAAVEAVKAVENDPDAEIDYDRDYRQDPSGDTRNARMWMRDALAAINSLRENNGSAA